LVILSKPSTAPSAEWRIVHTAEVKPLLACAGTPMSVLPWLSPQTAAGLAIVQVLAVLFHITRREWPSIVVNVLSPRSPVRGVRMLRDRGSERSQSCK
jgi:hypothetical protein